MRSRSFIVALAWSFLIACGSSRAPITPPAPQPGPQPGGSNLLSWTADAANGYIARFDQAPPGLIHGQLAQMYASGQRRLRLVVEFHEGGGDGVGLDSSTGTLNAKESANLASLLALIRSTGFLGLEIFIGEQWKNNPAQWVNPGAWDSPTYGKCVSAIVLNGQTVDSSVGDWYQQNWGFLRSVRAVVAASGIPYWIDLQNESLTPGFRDYARRLWRDYTLAYGASDTVGFSIIPDSANIALIPDIYQGRLPPVMDVHIYGSSPYGDPGQTLRGVSRDLARQGFGGPLIIGEEFYNDVTEAQSLAAVLPGLGRQILFTLQWPLTRGGVGPQNVIPLDFSAYHAAGF